MNWYCNIKPLPSDPVRGGNVGYISTAPTYRGENILIQSALQFAELVTARDVRHLMFGRTDFPRRLVPFEKAERWITKLIKEISISQAPKLTCADCSSAIPIAPSSTLADVEQTRRGHQESGCNASALRLYNQFYHVAAQAKQE